VVAEPAGSVPPIENERQVLVPRCARSKTREGNYEVVGDSSSCRDVSGGELCCHLLLSFLKILSLDFINLSRTRGEENSFQSNIFILPVLSESDYLKLIISSSVGLSIKCSF
jgi:hypothetical protein